MMSLKVASNKVEHLAGTLFGTHTEVTGDHRCVVLPNGARITPSPDLVLRGCRRDVLQEAFGVEVEAAVRANPLYQKEALQGHVVTECVTMTIEDRAENGAVIHMTLDEKEAFRIKGKLYD